MNIAQTSQTTEGMLGYLTTLDYREEEVLQDLKRQFQDQVASTRTMRQITCLKDLLRILKKRDAITMSRLDKIVDHLPQSIQTAYKQLKQVNHANEPNNIHSQNYINTSMQENIPRTGSKRNAHLERVYTIISEEIGPKHLKLLARHLDYKEAKIDTLFMNPNDSYESVRQVLRYHEETCSPALWRQNLLRALDKAKRVDLRMKVESKLDEYQII